MKTMLAILPVLLVGCASILNGTSDVVQVTSEPTGARLFVVGEGTMMTTARVTENLAITQLPAGAKFTAKTPATLRLSKKQNWTIYVAKSGYETEVVTLGKKVDAVYFLNIPFTLALGCLVDWGTGAWQRADQVQFHFLLEKVER